MSKSKSKPKSRARDLAALTVETPKPSTAKVEQGAVEAAMVAFLGSSVYQSLAEAAEVRKEVAEIEAQVRAFNRQQEELKTALSMLKREKDLLAVRGDGIVTERATLRADLKSNFLNSPAIARFRATVEKNFNKEMEEVLKIGLASDTRYLELEVEGRMVMASAAKLTTKIGKTEKSITALEKRITRLQAEVGKKNTLAKTLEGGLNA